MRFLTRLLLALLCLYGMTGCFARTVIKSELSSYKEPVAGELAHIRFIGSRNVKVYPNSDCVSYAVAGSGYPAGPQMGGQRKRDLGMPKTSDIPSHFVEIAAEADQRITASFSFYSEMQRPAAGAPGSFERSSSACSAARSFIPEANGNYEMRAIWRRGSCTVEAFKLVQAESGAVVRQPVVSMPASSCTR